MGPTYRSYQPLQPTTSLFLQMRWDQKDSEMHRRRVSSALPVVDNKGVRTPAHIQLKQKKRQLQDERQAVIARDNRLLTSKLADIARSEGLVDHWNRYHLRSLNANKRREELLLIDCHNQAMHRRLTSCQSEYRRQLWLGDWEKAKRRWDNISRYPQGLAEKQRSGRKVKFAAVEGSERSTCSSYTDSEPRMCPQLTRP